MMKKWVILSSLVVLPVWLSAADGASLYKQCAGCHGKDGRTKAFGKSESLVGQSAADIYETLMFFKESSFSQHGVTKVMAKQVKKLSPEDLKAVSEYIATFK